MFKIGNYTFTIQPKITVKETNSPNKISISTADGLLHENLISLEKTRNYTLFSLIPYTDIQSLETEIKKGKVVLSDETGLKYDVVILRYNRTETDRFYNETDEESYYQLEIDVLFLS